MVAVEVVARAAGRTEHSRVPVARKQRPHHGQLEPLARFRVPDEEATRPQARAAEEDAAMASVERAPAAVVGVGRAVGAGGDEAGHADVIAKEAKHGGRAVELAEPAAEAGPGDEAAPGLADEGGADEAGGLGRREAEKDLLDELYHQSRGPRRLSHGDWSDSAGGARRERGFGRGKGESEKKRDWEWERDG
ncbi:hypothetical protein PVAP13_2NG081076 [Panicum virgatum]|uniref:Uncharacterized protein n=1 Tax=Panicum virgatum TaxID=38727 RepID=A0A8T0VI72_PANVG|nr:hypothetical protein PVAP13_2NG081076 [Panicum virgatum]